MSQPPFQHSPRGNDDDEHVIHAQILEKPTGMRWFFNNDNPLWTMFPIILSILALWFAYKSNVINREWADVHLRITAQVFRGWIDYENYIFEDDVLHYQGTIGSLENLEEMMDTLQLASNDLGMRWLAEAANLDFEDYSIDDMPFAQYFIFLAIKNDGDQIAENMYVTFDYYNVDDELALRGEEQIPEGLEPEDWEYGPSLLAPDQWVMVPLGSCFIRLDPGSDEFEVKYMGDFYMPVSLRYRSAIGGTTERELDLETIPKTMSAFLEPPMPEEDGSSGGSKTNSGSGDGTYDPHSEGRMNRRD